MTTMITECRPSAATRRKVAAAWARYEAAVVEHGPADEWDRAVIEAAIRAIAAQGERFSVNDFRHLLPEVRKCLISRRLIALQREGYLVKVGTTPSTLESTHAADVKVYQLADAVLGDGDR